MMFIVIQHELPEMFSFYRFFLISGFN